MIQKSDLHKAMVQRFVEDVPEDRVMIDEIGAEGDKAAYRGTESGTHRAEFLHIPATGKSATWTEVQFFRFQDGKVVEHWIDVDLFSWFQQLGSLPPMGG
jgi:predicted ester cyclase